MKQYYTSLIFQYKHENSIIRAQYSHINMKQLYMSWKYLYNYGIALYKLKTNNDANLKFLYKYEIII